MTEQTVKCPICGAGESFFLVDEDIDKRIDDYFASKPVKTRKMIQEPQW